MKTKRFGGSDRVGAQEVGVKRWACTKGGRAQEVGNTQDRVQYNTHLSELKAA
jgi:hypothetical protein